MNGTAHTEGYLAYANKLPEDACPYPSGSYGWFDWLAGWDKAEDDCKVTKEKQL